MLRIRVLFGIFVFLETVGIETSKSLEVPGTDNELTSSFCLQQMKVRRMEEETCGKNETLQIDAGLSDILERFGDFRARYNQLRCSLSEKDSVIRAQQERLRLAQEAEDNLKRKLENFQSLMTDHQQVLDNLLGVNEDNLKLVAENKQIRSEREELLEKMRAERESFQHLQDSIDNSHKQEIKDLTALYEGKISDARADLAVYKTEYDMKRREMDSTFQALRLEKRKELDITTQIFEGKCQQMEEAMRGSLCELEQRVKDREATIEVYKQKVVDLERRLMRAEVEARRKSQQPPSSGCFRYNNNALVAPPQPPAAILKKQQQQRSGRTNNNIQPLEFLEDSVGNEDRRTGKKVTFSGPKKRKLFNPHEDDF